MGIRSWVALVALVVACDTPEDFEAGYDRGYEAGFDDGADSERVTVDEVRALACGSGWPLGLSYGYIRGLTCLPPQDEDTVLGYAETGLSELEYDMPASWGEPSEEGSRAYEFRETYLVCFLRGYDDGHPGGLASEGCD